MEQQRQQRRPSCRNALYLSLACSLLGVAAASSSNAFHGAAFAPPSTPDETIQRRESRSSVRLFSSLPLWSKQSPSSSSLQHPDNHSQHTNSHYHPQPLQQHPYPSKRSPDHSKRGQASSSRLNSAAALVLEDYSDYVINDPFDPETFRPPSWEDTWGPPPVVPSTVSRDTIAPLPADAASPFRIFVDLDGVLCDFERGVQAICRKSTAEIAKTTMWTLIAKSNSRFFETLPWTRDGPKLWHAIRHLGPDILTGVPDLETSREEKFNWCRRHLGMQDYRHVDMAGDGYRHNSVNGTPKACKVNDGPITNVITCWSYNKHHESGQHAVLIDDRIALKDSWEAKGGIFVHHTDAETTLKQLEELGIPVQTVKDEDIPRP